jgi:uncharacterized protein YecA (UPF0149 family)
MGIIKNFFNRIISEDQPAPTRTLGRNEPCWCGSGKKYKKCHLEEDAKKRSKSFSMNCGPT